MKTVKNQKGKSRFTSEEIETITALIEKKLKSNENDQKRIRQQIRDLGFYASAFGLGGGYTVEDFMSVINRGSATDVQRDIIVKYKEILSRNKLKDELYKWELLGKHRGHPNPDAPDFAKEFNDVSFHNLLYFNALTVARHIFREKPERYARCLKDLFNENKPLADRIRDFDQSILTVYREVGGTMGHHHDERTMATLLTYHNPEKYSFYKDSFYQKYCKLLGIPPRNKGEKYVHYLDLLGEFRTNHVDADASLLSQVNALLPDGAFKDPTHTLLSQDILYTVLDKDREIDIGDSKVFKISMGSFGEKELNACIEESIVLVHKDTKPKGKVAESQAYYFESVMQVGDYFYLTHGNAKGGMKLLGRITSAPSESRKAYGEHTGWMQRNFEILESSASQAVYAGPKKWWSPNDNSTCIQIPAEELDDANKLIFRPYFNVRLVGNQPPEQPIMREPDHEHNRNEMTLPLNRILYGPPGTGKTYHSINLALEIIEGKSLEDLQEEDRQLLKARFDRYISEGRIVFTTFHQSMSYEDFIEGIKPNVDDKEDDVFYEIKDGIFKSLCIEAAFSIARNTNKANVAQALSFSEAYDEFFNSVEKTLSTNEAPGREDSIWAELPTKSGGSVKIVDVSNQGNLILQHVNGEKKYTISKDRLSRLDREIGDLDSISNIDSAFREVIGGSNSSAYWAVLKAIRSLKPSKTQSSKSVFDKVDKAAAVKSLASDDYRKVAGEPYVIIIDEVNRGNVSQIFGELITLIEADKRLGRDEALDAVLPYSRERFGVPPNLYIIGSMNTADRSVEALDTALRRRFSFNEMMPTPDLIRSKGKAHVENGLVDGYDLGELLTRINSRIEKLLDKDHLIGHSYFMDVNSPESLKAAFQNKINPLLQEYFYGDFGKIGLVLGSAFFEEIQDIKKDDNFFADFPEYEVSELLERNVYRLRNVEDMTNDEFRAALSKLLKK